eukprot:7767039-Alexandrium_andersonii.AAC.1
MPRMLTRLVMTTMVMIKHAGSRSRLLWPTNQQIGLCRSYDRCGGEHGIGQGRSRTKPIL